MGQRNYNQDLELVFHDGAAALTASGAGQVGGQASIRDVGANSRFEAVMVIDITNVKVSAGNELVTLIVQGSNTADFSGAKETLAMMDVGATAARAGAAISSTPGRLELPFTNEQDDARYRYLRVFAVVAGTAPSLTFKAWASTKY